ncbi:MAG: tRNA (adenosine(37)-N6)-dimethylallyltransferase MiaA, partial [Lachnospiraceae bacterium]|nr:tRNA (adenosine(37)-N6)-dimethylallyltransferase MiaA [Lachnospiraceae bacterium]
MKQKLIVIAGPTASGKSSLAVLLAERIGGEIISADSMQVYRFMDIGSAKIREEEKHGIRHYLIDCLDPEEEFNIVRFQELAGQAMTEIYERGKIPIIAGGTGFYIQSVLYQVDFGERTEDTDLSFRNSLSRLAEEKGPRFLHEMLREVDPASAEAIHENNVKRVIRALEYHRETGRRISDHNREQRERESPYELYYYVLNMPRPILYERIDRRVDQMLKDGLIDEVKGLMERGLTDRNLSMQGLGYKEFYRYLTGSLTLSEATEIVKRDTRHFAKRQLTWFKREKDARWLSLERFDYDPEKTVDYMLKDMEKPKVSLREGTYGDAEEIYGIMKQVFDELENKELYCLDDLESVQGYLSGDGYAVVACDEESGRIAASLICQYPGRDPSNLGNDIGLSEEECDRVLHMESAVVLPAYRGQHLEKRLLEYAEERADRSRTGYLMATVSPHNPAS